MRNVSRKLAKSLSLLLCIILSISTVTNAQVKKLPNKKSLAKTIPSKQMPIVTTPAAGSVIDGPFVLVGKAEPNSSLNLRITPIYKLPKRTDGKTTLIVSTPAHKPQEVVVKADANGVWQSPLMEVIFDPKTTDRRIFALVSQTWDGKVYSGKQIEYQASPKLTILLTPIKDAPKPKDEGGTPGQPEKDEPLVKGDDEMAIKIISPTDNKFVDREDFKISGKASNGSMIEVEVRYWGYKSKSKITIENFGPHFYPAVNRSTKIVNGELWKTFTLKSSGTWITNSIKFIGYIDGYSCWANNYTVNVSYIDQNGKRSGKKTITVSRMKTKAI